MAIGGIDDPDGDPVVVAVTSVTQDEPLRRSPCGDAAGLGEPVAQLRAAHGRGRGRAYRVRFEADDGRDGQCAGSVLVCVPDTRLAESACAENGATIYATAPSCTGVCAVACGVERTLGYATCAGEDVPPKLSRAVEKARRRMVRTAKRGVGTWTAGAIRSMERAVRMAGAARATGTISEPCADDLDRILSDARTAANPLR